MLAFHRSSTTPQTSPKVLEEEMEDIRGRLEMRVDQLSKLEVALMETFEKLDEVVRRVILQEKELNQREQTKLMWEIEDLEKEELSIEVKYHEKRLEIVKLRQDLRKKIFERQGRKDDQRSILTTLQSSNFATSYKQVNPRDEPSTPVSRNGSTVYTDVNSDDFVFAQWNLNPKEIEYDKSSKPIGSGAFGDVYRGRLRGKEVAVKKLVFQELDEATMSEFKKECAVMAKLRHPNIILFMGACIAVGNLSMVVELMPKGSVFDRLHDDKIKLGLMTRVLFAKDTALGMACLHGMTPPFLHLDLKSQNLLVDDNWTVKVSDFGLSQIKKVEKTVGKAGSPLYMAPEMLLDQGYNEKADVYSFGIVLWELYTHLEPYNKAFKSFDEMLEAVTKKGRRPDIPEDCPLKYKDLMQQCWNPDPQYRPSFAKIVSSHILDEIVIESTISPKNDIGRAFWKEKYLEKTIVDWKDFLISFSRSIGFEIPKDPEDIKMQCLKELIVRRSNQGKDEVHLEDFGKMLEWFGPLEKGNSILKRIETQLRSKGFYGDIETGDAEKLLNGKKTGSYLVRFSTRDPGCYAITVLSKVGALKHYRITHKAGGRYILGTSEYDSLEALIKAHKKDLHLKLPLGGSRYESMFIADEKKLASQGYMDQSQIKP